MGQTSDCEKAKTSKSDRKLIEQFWTNFKRAVNTEDKTELSFLIKFPFNCDYCIFDSTKDKNYDYLKVTRKLFDNKQFKIFFDNKLKKTINKFPTLFDILSVTTDGTGKKCDFNFSYISVEPSKTWEGQQHFFSIGKINGKFLITSAWTVP